MQVNVVFREDPTLRAAGVGVVASLAVSSGADNLEDAPRVSLSFDDDGALVVSQVRFFFSRSHFPPLIDDFFSDLCALSLVVTQ
jgi:acid phosphatase class B